jgi:hypothetical protein
MQVSPKLPDTLSFFGQNIFLSTLFSHALSQCSSLDVRDQVLRPFRNTSKTPGRMFVFLLYWRGVRTASVV